MSQASVTPPGRSRPSRVMPLLRGVPWAAVAVTSLWGAFAGDWVLASVAASCISLALLPKAYSAVIDIAFPAGLSTGILCFCAAALLGGELGGFYVRLWWWDIALHFVAAAVLAVFGMALAMTATGGRRPQGAIWMLATCAFGFAVMVGVMWELMEFSIDAIFGTNAQRSGLPDTMGDQAVNVLGAALGAIAGHAHVHRGARWPLAGLLGRFMDVNPTLYPNRSHRPGGPLA